MPHHIGILHGWNVRDGGAGTIDRVKDYAAGRNVVIHDLDYAPDFQRNLIIKGMDLRWLFGLRKTNARAVADILPQIEQFPGMVLIGHSNGCLVLHELVKAGAPIGAAVCLQPALRRDTEWPEDLPVLCTYSKRDYIVRYGARWWGRFASVAKPWRDRHGWGAAGYYGFDDPSKTKWRVDVGPTPAPEHSDLFKDPAADAWIPQVLRWGISAALTSKWAQK